MSELVSFNAIFLPVLASLAHHVCIYLHTNPFLFETNVRLCTFLRFLRKFGCYCKNTMFVKFFILEINTSDYNFIISKFECRSMIFNVSWWYIESTNILVLFFSSLNIPETKLLRVCNQVHILIKCFHLEPKLILVIWFKQTDIKYMTTWSLLLNNILYIFADHRIFLSLVLYQIVHVCHFSTINVTNKYTKYRLYDI